MDIKSKMNTKFRDLQGGLFLTVTKADVGEGAGNFQKNGGDIMAWADPFFPDPSIPDSVKKALLDAVESGIPAHYVMPIGMLEFRQALAEKIQSATITIPMQASDDNHLFGSVTERIIAEALAAQGIVVDVHKIRLENQIRMIGEFSVEIRILRDISATAKISVVRA